MDQNQQNGNKRGRGRGRGSPLPNGHNPHNNNVPNGVNGQSNNSYNNNRGRGARGRGRGGVTRGHSPAKRKRNQDFVPPPPRVQELQEPLKTKKKKRKKKLKREDSIPQSDGSNQGEDDDVYSIQFGSDDGNSEDSSSEHSFNVPPPARESRSVTPPSVSTVEWQPLQHDQFSQDLPTIFQQTDSVIPSDLRRETVVAIVTSFKRTMYEKVAEMERCLDVLHQASIGNSVFWNQNAPFLVSLTRYHLQALRNARELQGVESKYEYFMRVSLTAMKWDPRYQKLKRKLDTIKRKSIEADSPTSRSTTVSNTESNSIFDDPLDEFSCFQDASMPLEATKGAVEAGNTSASTLASTLASTSASTSASMSASTSTSTSASMSASTSTSTSAVLKDVSNMPLLSPTLSNNTGKRKAEIPPPQNVQVESRVHGAWNSTPSHLPDQTEQRSKTLVVEGSTRAPVVTSASSSSSNHTSFSSSGCKLDLPAAESLLSTLLSLLNSSSSSKKVPNVATTSASNNMLTNLLTTQPSALSQPAPHASKPTSTEAKPRYTAYYSGPWRPPPSPPAASTQPSGSGLSKNPTIPVTGSLVQNASAAVGGSKPETASSQMPAQAASLSASPATRTSSAPAAVAVQNTAPAVPEVANLSPKVISVPAPATSVSVASSSSRPALSLGPAASPSTEDWESNPIVTALLKKAVEVSTSRTMAEMTQLASSPVAAPRIVPAVTSSPTVSAPNVMSPKASVSVPPVIPSTTASTTNNIINTKPGINEVECSSSAKASAAGPSAAGPSEKSVIISTPKPMTPEAVQTLSVVPATAPVSSENTARATEPVSVVETTTEINHSQPSPAAPSETTSMAPPAPPFPPPSNLSSPSAGKLRPVSDMNTRDRNDERLRTLEKEVAWLLEYRGAPLTVSDHEALSWSQQLKRFTSDVEDLHQKVDHNKRVTSKVSNLFDILNRAFDVHSSVMTETETRGQALRREDTATVSREMAQIREQALSQKLETEKMQRLLEANQRKEAERAVAQAEYDLKVEKMLVMMETKLRTSAEEGMVRCQNELQEQRIQTLEKDLECRRSEALVMAAKANEEIKEAHLQVAKAREERAVAREHAARLELEREQLLKRIQELEAKRNEGPVGLATPTEVSSALFDSVSLCPTREADE